VTPKEKAERTVFPNPALASSTLKISGPHISQCCGKKLNTTGGWCWMYYEDYIEQNSNEEWRKIELNSRKFKVSSLGRVRLPNGLISRGSLDVGYLRVSREKHYVHRLVALTFCPKEDGKEYVNHNDGNSTNNIASNLEWCSHKDNIHHAMRLFQRVVKQIFDNGSNREFSSLAE
ncbi:3231_t:CDS:2, partial [Funneliformis geosporum]